MMDAGTAKSLSIQRSSVRRALFSRSSSRIRAWARCNAAASFGASSCACVVVESSILSSLHAVLTSCFQRAANRLVGDAIAVRDLAEGVALLNAVQDLR